MLRSLVSTLLVGALSLGLVGCTSGSAEGTPEPIVPTATLTLTASPGPTETPAATETPDAEPRRTGDAGLDVIIKAVEERDIATLAPLVVHPTVACTTAQGMGGPPKCEEGMPEGTEMQVFPFASCEGEWTRFGVQTVAQFAHRTAGLWGVIDVDQYWGSTDGWETPDTFLAFHTESPSEDFISYLEVADGRIVRASYGCGGTLDDLLAVSSLQLSLAHGPWDEPAEVPSVTPPTTGVEAVDGILAMVANYDTVGLTESARRAMEDLPLVACEIDPIGPGGLPCGPKDSPDEPISVFPLAFCEGVLERDPANAIRVVLNGVPQLHTVVEAPDEESPSDLYPHGAYWVVYALTPGDTGFESAARLHITAEGNLTAIWYGCGPPIEQLLQFEGEPLPEIEVRPGQ